MKKPKTFKLAIEALANLLKDDEKKLFLENIKNLRRHVIDGEDVQSCPKLQFLYGSFYWDESPQGYHYWHNICKQIDLEQEW